MRLLRVALGIAFLSVTYLKAADQEEEKQQPDEIPDFNQIDEYTYVPKSTLSIATRLFLTGPRTSYSGQGSIPSATDNSAANVPNISHTYFDGAVNPDTRSTLGTNGVGESYSIPIAPDGRTNTWNYTNASQLLPNGDIAFHTYAGDVTDTGSHSANGTPSVGLELLWDRDMGKLGKHFKWAITAGFSIADIHSSVYASVPTQLQTVTDSYDLFGQVPPSAPYGSPNSISQAVFNSSGQAVSGQGTSSQTQQVDQTILLGNVPLGRTTAITDITTINRYFIEGAYYTLRIGPTLIFPMGNHFKFSISAGPDILYAGSELNVLENLTFDESTTPVPQLYQKENTHLLPGYYVDVDLRYDFTETAGLYVGALYEGGGSYTQSVPSGETFSTPTTPVTYGTSYNTKIDFGNQEGVKAGMTFRF